ISSWREKRIRPPWRPDAPPIGPPRVDVGFFLRGKSVTGARLQLKKRPSRKTNGNTQAGSDLRVVSLPGSRALELADDHPGRASYPPIHLAPCRPGVHSRWRESLRCNP